MSDETTGDKWDTQGALINIKSGQYGRTYKVNINGSTVASFTTPDGKVQVGYTFIKVVRGALLILYNMLQ